LAKNLAISSVVLVVRNAGFNKIAGQLNLWLFSERLLVSEVRCLKEMLYSNLFAKLLNY